MIKRKKYIYRIYIAPFSNLRSFKGTLHVYYPAHWVIRELVVYTLAIRAAWLINSHPHRCPFYTWVRWGTCGISSMPRKTRWSVLNPGPLDPEARVLPLDHSPHDGGLKWTLLYRRWWYRRQWWWWCLLEALVVTKMTMTMNLIKTSIFPTVCK